MKLSDLFLPKIARSDPKVRKDAVRETNDLKLLQNVIKNDSDQGVRLLARKRIRALTADGLPENAAA